MLSCYQKPIQVLIFIPIPWNFNAFIDFVQKSLCIYYLCKFCFSVTAPLSSMLEDFSSKYVSIVTNSWFLLSFLSFSFISIFSVWMTWINVHHCERIDFKEVEFLNMFSCRATQRHTNLCHWRVFQSQ